MTSPVACRQCAKLEHGAREKGCRPSMPAAQVCVGSVDGRRHKLNTLESWEKNPEQKRQQFRAGSSRRMRRQGECLE